jgi:AtzE family amidohydrolase
MMELSRQTSATSIADRVRRGEWSAEFVTRRYLDFIQEHNATFCCFTRVLADRAISDAKKVDEVIASKMDPGPLAGVPFGVKDLFDIAGITTTAGSKVREHAFPAKWDAMAITRLKDAGAVLVGTLNMDEFAYGFATVNPHYGTTRNPNDVSRLAGGSSGGSAAAVSAGLVPISLGSDTNGSVRVPASLCGIWSIRPADDVIPMDGVFPFVEILDTVGPFARCMSDLAIAYEVLSGQKLERLGTVPRVAKLGGWFERNASTEALDAVDQVMKHLSAQSTVNILDAEVARSASYLITAAQGGALHLDTLRSQAMQYDPAVRDRLIALKAMTFRENFRKSILELFQRYDVLISACTPIVAPSISDATMMVDGKIAPARAHLGIYTQPISLAGIPAVSAPLHRPNALPIGVQFATAPGREQLLFELLAKLEYEGLLKSNALPNLPQFATQGSQSSSSLASRCS